MKYFEILEGTDLYQTARMIFDYKNDWLKEGVKKDLEVLGIEIEENLELNPRVLCLKKIPTGMESQFKKPNKIGRREAKAKSDMNVRYLEIVKKHNLKTYTMYDLISVLNSFEIPMLCPVKTHSNFRLFFAIDDFEKWNDILEKFKKDPRLQEVKESEYLQAKLISVKEREENESI